MMNSQNKNKLIPARTSLGNTKSASSIQHQVNDDNSTTVERMKIRNIHWLMECNNSQN